MNNGDYPSQRSGPTSHHDHTFGDRSSHLKDVYPEESFRSKYGKSASRLAGNDDPLMSSRRPMHTTVNPNNPDERIRKSARSSFSHTSAVPEITTPTANHTSSTSGISSGIEPFLAKQVRSLAAARNAQTRLQLPILRDILEVPAEPTNVGPEATNQYHIDLQTGEDAIKFFIQHGNNNPLKFVYCNRTDGSGAAAAAAPEPVNKQGLTREQARALAIAKLAKVTSTEHYRPYDLTIVSKKQVAPQYYTVSASGVVCLSKGEPSEFLSLTEWLHQSAAFNTLRSIRFFRHYLTYKTLALWRANVRYRVFRKHRSVLAQNLFLARPTFCAALLDANRVVHDMKHTALIQHHHHTHNILLAQEFKDNQATERARATQTLEQRVGELEAQLLRVCGQVRDRAREYDESIASNDLSVAKHAQHLLRDGAKATSMVSVRQAREARVQQLRHAALEADMLGDLIRLVDYMQVAALSHAAVTNVAELLSVLHEASRARRPLFQTAVSFGDKSLQFTPGLEELTAMLCDTAEGAVMAAATTDRVLLLPKLKPFVSYALADYPLVGRTVANDPIFTSCLCALESKIKADFGVVSGVVSVVEKYRTVFEFGRTWRDSPYVQRGAQAVDWAAQHGAMVRGAPSSPLALVDVSVDEVERAIELQNQWLGSIGNIKNSYEGGVFQAESKGLKGDLVPVVQNAIAGMKDYLLCKFRLDASELRENVRERVRMLREEPTELALFAKHVSTYRSIVAESKELMGKAREVEYVFALLEKHQVDVTIDSVQYEEVEALLGEFGEQLLTCEHKIEDKMGVMKGQVYQRIAKLTADLHNQRARLLEGEFVSDKAKPELVLAELKNVEDTVTILKAEMARVEEYQVVFGMDPYRFEEPLREVTRAFDQKQRFWTLYRDWLRLTGEWNRVDFSSLDVEQMNVTVRTMYASAHELSKQIRDKQGREVPVTVRLKRLIQEYKTYMPVLLELGNPGMKAQHWREIFAAMGQTWTAEDHTLKKLRALNIFSYKELVAQVCESAVGEHALQESLHRIEDAWSKANLVVVPYHKQPDVSILGEMEEVSVLLEEHQMVVQGMLGSQYVKALQTQVEEWERRLSLMSEVLDEWVSCQRGWMYMEPIFTAPDIQRQLPAEAKSFAEIDRQWRELMRRTKKNPNALAACLHHTLLSSLQQHNTALEAIEKHLEEYLELKRSAFPRFYFLSNDELLTILSESRDVDAVQVHLQQCFDNIQRLVLSDAPPPEPAGKAGSKPSSAAAPVRDVSRAVLGMVSAEGEVVPLAGRVLAQGGAEGWLAQVEKAMRKTIRGLIKRALVTCPTVKTQQDASEAARGTWLLQQEHPAQALVAADQILWTRGVEAALVAMQQGDARAMTRYLGSTKAVIGEMVELIRGELTLLQRQLIANLLIVDVHNRDIVDELARTRVQGVSDFEWSKQLRYYWADQGEPSWVLAQGTKGRKAASAVVPPLASNVMQESAEMQHSYDVDAVVNAVGAGEDCFLSQLTGRFQYRYEYLGNASRLVMTALTDKCYLTLTGALAMHNGGAPQGPAGTGKTETVKDLGKAMATQVVVFNCSDGLEVHTMSRFFSGLCQAGAWACFDEFNRIDIEVLSVIAQQIMTIQTAIMQGKSPFDFQGRVIPLDASFGVFITMNPGYAGRTELPDNLKALFRPISMMVPDYAMIAQIMLFSEGFLTAPSLASKMVQLYKLASEQLSKQDHYDFGMRAVKSVLVMAGALKRRAPDDSEDVVLIRAMRDSNVPKFKEEDIPLFQGIISDLFPGVHVPTLAHPVLHKHVCAALEDRGLAAAPSLVRKVIQLHETIEVRTGVMLVGEAMTGKSTCVAALAEALRRSSRELAAAGIHEPFIQPVQHHRVNPKAVSIAQLYGSVSPVSNEWTDGLVSDLVRTLAADKSADRKWVVFDGPVDALWVENLNTVLDDNKMLCLVNSERIRLTPQMNVLFEVGDLAHASPATVSRCGMVYLEQAHLPYDALLRHWMQGTRARYPALAHAVPEWVAAVVREAAPALLQAAQDKSVSLRVLPNQLVRSCMTLFEALAQPVLGRFRSPSAAGALEDGLMSPGDDDEPLASATPVPASLGCDRDTLRALSLCLCVACTWSFGAAIGDEHRTKYSHALRTTLVALASSPTLPSPLAAGLSSPLAAIAETPASDSAYDLYLAPDCTSLVSWKSLVPAFTYDPEAPFHSLIVPTAESVCVDTLLATLLTANTHILVAGETGTGKSVCVDALLRRMDKQFLAIPVQMCGRTQPHALTEALEFRLEKKGKKSVLGVPRGGRTGAVLYVDDLNMPATERYGAQPPLELLRQVIDQGGYYDLSRKKPFFKRIQDTTHMATMAPVGGGRTEPSTRLTRHYHVLWLRQLSSASMSSIYTHILGGFLQHHAQHLQTDLTQLTSALVAASVDVYHACKRSLLPVPTKPHYTFNLRDLGRVVQGLTQARKQAIPDTANLVRLWLHEAARVFRDRLVDDGDRAWFDRQCQQRLSEHLGLDWPADAFQDLLFGDFVAPRIPDGSDASAAAAAERHYEELLHLGSVQAQLESQLQEYNLVLSTSLNLVFFKSAVQHLARIARVLRQPRGHALLVGVGGSGRQSLTRLAAFLSDYSCVSVEVSVGYGVPEWRDALKQLLENAAFGPQPCVFLLSEEQLQEAFLEDVNALVNKGEVGGLFTAEEWDALVLKARPLAKKQGLGETREAAIMHFNQLVRERLHVVLALANEGASLRERVRMYPGLVNCCVIDWYSDWPREALMAVARQYFTQTAQRLATTQTPALGTAAGSSQGGLVVDESVDLGQLFATYRDKLSEVCVEMHMSVVTACEQYHRHTGRHAHVTPTSFIALLDKYVDLLSSRRAHLVQQLSVYRNGVAQLQRTNVLVNELRADLIKLQPVLQQSATETAALLVELEREEKDAQDTRRVCQAEAAETEVQTRQVAAIAQDCEADLAEAMPAMEAAQKSLAVLRRDHINILKSLPHPPQLIKTLMEAVCILFNQPTDWNSAKALLGRNRFIESCREYDKDNIPAKTLKKIQKYVQDKDFRPEKMESVSEAAVSLCLWVRALDVYARVYANVEPKRVALGKARERLEVAERKLHEQQEQVRLCEARVSSLQDKLQRKERERQELEHSIDRTTRQVERAQALLTSLSVEGERWEEQCREYQAQVYSMCGDTLLGAGVVGYCGVFTQKYRQELCAGWVRACQQRHIPLAATHVEHGFSLQAALGDALTVRQWTTSGLPKDQYSIDSAIVAITTAGGSASGAAMVSSGGGVSAGVKWPLIVDPQGQAGRWLKQLFKHENLQVATLPAPTRSVAGEPAPAPSSAASGEKPWRSVLENCVRFGVPLLLECEGEELDGALDPLLTKQVYRRGGQWVCRLGSQEVPYSPGFRLYLTCRHANPRYTASVFAKACVVNFGVTRAGVEDQLLGVACAIERSTLEQRADTLLCEMSKDKRELREKEARVLQLLQESGGHILEDEEVMNTLTGAQEGAKLVSARVTEAERTMREIEKAREAYRPLASHAAMLYVCVTQLSAVDHMYQYSLQYFTSLFAHVLHTTKDATTAERADADLALSDEEVGARVQSLVDELTWAVFSAVSRGVYVRDRGLLGLLFALHCAVHRGTATPAQMRLLISSAGAAHAADHTAAAVSLDEAVKPAFLDAVAWEQLCTAARGPFPALATVAREMQRESTAAGSPWRQWVHGDAQAAAADAGDASLVPVAAGLPHGNSLALTPLEQLALIRITRPALFAPAAQRYVARTLGNQFTHSQPSDVAQCYRDSSPAMPTLFLLSSGADPLPSILSLADTLNAKATAREALQVNCLSMGQGQGARAVELIERAKREGHWVVLQNCHLCVSFMPALEAIVEKTARETDVHPAYRLWLTSLPTLGFSVSVLQNSLKVTTEMPRGVANAIMQAYTDMGSVAFQYSDAPAGVLCDNTDLSVVYRRLVFALTALHAVMVERKKYGGLGWNVRYEWMWTDLYTCVEQVRQWCQSVNSAAVDGSLRGDVSVPWSMLRHMVGDVHYGGRVTDDKDQRCVRALVSQFLAPEVVLQNQPLLTLAVDAEGAPTRTLSLPDATTCLSVEAVTAHCVDVYTDAPAVFGLHETAATTVALQETHALLAQLQTATGALAQASPAGDGSGSDAAVAEALDKVERGLPTSLPSTIVASLDECVRTCSSVAAPMAVFVRQEVHRLNKLIAAIAQTLAHTKQALRGEQVMSAATEAIVRALTQGRVPSAWASVAYPSCRGVHAWVRDLSTRAHQYRLWAQHLLARMGSSAGTAEEGAFVYWLSGMFFPQGFLTAVLQTHARTHNIPIDSLTLSATVLTCGADAVRAEGTLPTGTHALVADEVSTGVVVKGLWLQGAAWSTQTHSLAEAQEGELFAALPLVHLRAVRKDEQEKEEQGASLYRCPMYKTRERAGELSTTGHSTNFVTMVSLPCGKGEAHWVKRGGAVILENSEEM